MTGHLTDNILELMRTKKLPADELMVADDHLAACSVCRDAITRSFSSTGTAGGFERAIFQPAEHLDYQELEAFVDGRLSVEGRADVIRHIEACGECGDELRELQEFAGRLASEVSPARAGLLSSLRAFFVRPVPVLASIAVLLTVASMIWLATREADIADVTSTLGAPIAESVPAPLEPQVSEEPANVPVENPPTELAVSINDGGETVGISKNGELLGYASVRSNYKALVTKALSDERLPMADLRDLKGKAGVLMGDNSSPTGSFRITSPVGKVVNDDTPTFRWQSVPGASRYVVEVFDQDFNKVASSGEIKNTSWKQKFARGRIYSWQVTAMTGGEVLKAPQRPQPDARFRILDRKTADELSALRRSNSKSHLLLGVAYANAGLLDDAIRELEILVQQNQGNELPRKMLRQLRSAR